MPVETLQSPLRQPVRISQTPPRLRPKAPLGPAFNRQSPLPAPRPRQSAVERLEADKAKYVKSQVALSKQQPAQAAETRKAPLNATATISSSSSGGGSSRGGGSALQPTRKAPSHPSVQQAGLPLDLEHLSKLISGVNDRPAHAAPTPTPTPTATATATAGDRTHGGPTRSSPLRGPVRAEHREVRSPPPPATTDWSSPAKVRLKACGPVKAEPPQGQDAVLPPATVTVRRVDVVPQSRTPRKPPARPPQYMRQPLYPVTWQGLHPLRPATSNLRLFPQRSPLAPPVPLKPLRAPPPPDVAAAAAATPAGEPPAPPPRTSSSSSSAAPPPPPGLLPPPLQASSPLVFPPPSSPAVTRLSSSSSRKRPSLTRSKSDMSDRCSRAGTELERFFTLCGLDPAEVTELAAGPGSDIVSMARFRSASAPGSECQEGGGGEEEEDDEEGGGAACRVPYGVSVIERNARVIKWLYNVRQEAKDSRSTNM